VLAAEVLPGQKHITATGSRVGAESVKVSLLYKNIRSSVRRILPMAGYALFAGIEVLARIGPKAVTTVAAIHARDICGRSTHVKACSFPTLNSRSAASIRRPHVSDNVVQRAYIMADFAIANGLWIGGIIARIIGIIGMTYDTFGSHVPFEPHVMGDKVAGNVPAVFMVAYELTPLVVMVIGRGVAGVTLRTGVGIKSNCRVDQILLPMAILAGKYRWGRY
jgi:hypothetical protein